MHEVSRRVWGLRLRRTDPELALAFRLMLPSAHYKDVGVRVASFRSSIAHPTYSPVYASPCTSRYPTQNSGPSGSLLLTRENFSFSASCRFSPAHRNGDGNRVGGEGGGGGAAYETGGGMGQHGKVNISDVVAVTGRRASPKVDCRVDGLRADGAEPRHHTANSAHDSCRLLRFNTLRGCGAERKAI